VRRFDMTTGRSSISRLLPTLAAFILILEAAGSVNAQKSRPTPPPPAAPGEPRNDPKGDRPGSDVRSFERATAEMQILLSSRNRELSTEIERRRLDNQLNRDLQRLEELDSVEIAPLSSAKSFDYRMLERVSSEIKDRATRIKFNTPLLLRIKNAEKIEYEEDARKLKSFVPELSRVIKSFLNNPVFRVNSPNDSDLRSNAGKDLEKIIKLSKTINRIAKRLKQNGQTA